LTPSLPRVRSARLYPLFFVCLLATVATPRRALAEKVIATVDNWQVYTDGRVGAFLTWVHGDPAPLASAGESIVGGGWSAPTEPNTDNSRGTINMMRIRSGFLGNQLGLGVRGPVTQWTTVTGYMQIWAWTESDERNKTNINYADVRQGYAKLEGPWGSLLAGRTRTLFSRGATDIDVLYGHRWGVGGYGTPNMIQNRGPTQGMVGFGVMGSGFGAGMIYGTPVASGFQLNVGIFDPATLGGVGWNGTKYVRPEAELTFERRLGETGKLVLFGDFVYQNIYKPGSCTVSANNPCAPLEESVEGVGYGGRFELGPFHLGAAGFYGKGLGTSFALENSYAAADPNGTLRWSDGYYLQSQLVLSKFDLFAGWGIVRMFLTDLDKNTTGLSVLKHQMGINAGLVYNMTPNVHFDLEYFRAEATWFLGEKQVLNCGATGMTFNW
jgi:Gram-negative porin